MKQYKVYTRPNTWELEKIVNEELAKGGELVGGVTGTYKPYTPSEIQNPNSYNRLDSIDVTFSQAMLIVKEE